MQRRRHSPTGAELQAWRDYIETAELLRTKLAGRMQEASSLSPGDYRVLLALSETAGVRLRSSELATNIGWERSRLSHHLRRMEARGLVQREECMDDSRGAEVVLTDAGHRAFRRASAPHLRAVQELFLDALSPEQLAGAIALTQVLRAHLDRVRGT